MKKSLFLLLFCLCACAGFAQDSRMLVNPGRETFVNFPSNALGWIKTMTVFLPEESVPLKGTYPAVYVLGAGPKDAREVQAFLDASAQKAIIVGVDLSDKELKDVSKAVDFFAKELVPYIDTNYPTYAYPESRVIAGTGADYAAVAASLLSKPGLFNNGALLAPGTEAVKGGLPTKLRLFLRGSTEELAAWQKYLDGKGFEYGRNFVYRLGDSRALADNLPLAYFFGAAKDTAVRKAEASVSAKTLALDDEAGVSFTVKTVLQNGLEFDCLPESLRLSPPYLSWDASKGRLFAVSGAEAGTVKIRGFADRAAFTAKIKLKKQEK